jgi:hypothetical protein
VLQIADALALALQRGERLDIEPILVSHRAAAVGYADHSRAFARQKPCSVYAHGAKPLHDDARSV